MTEKAIFVEKEAKSYIESKRDFADKKSLFSAKIKGYSYQDFKWDMNIICHLTFKAAYVCYSVLQFFATWAGLVKISHTDNIFTFLISLGLGFLPFFGTFFGIFGAHTGWGWDLTYSFMVFLAPYVVVNGPILLIASIDIYKDWLRWKSEEAEYSYQ